MKSPLKIIGQVRVAALLCEQKYSLSTNAGGDQQDDGDAAQLCPGQPGQADHLRQREHPARHLRLLLLLRLVLRK